MNKINRRSILKSGTVVTALSLVGQVQANPGQTRKEEKFFGEVSLQYEGAPDFSKIYSDPFLDYNLINNSTLQLNKHIDKDRFKNHSSIIKSNWGFLPSDTRIDSQRQKQLPIKIGRDMSEVEWLELRNRENVPGISVKYSKEGMLNLNVNGTKLVVGPSGKKSFSLPDKNVEVNKPTSKSKHIRDSRDEESRQRRVYESKSYELTPKVEITNYGGVRVKGEGE